MLDVQISPAVQIRRARTPKCRRPANWNGSITVPLFAIGLHDGAARVTQMHVADCPVAIATSYACDRLLALPICLTLPEVLRAAESGPDEVSSILRCSTVGIVLVDF